MLFNINFNHLILILFHFISTLQIKIDIQLCPLDKEQKTVHKHTSSDFLC